MTYRVVAPLLVVPDLLGHHHHRYHGQLINWPMPDANREHLLEHGWIEELPAPPGVVPADADELAATVPPASDPAAAAEQSAARPLQAAPKDQWVEYAVTARGVDRAQAEAMTKPDLQALG